VIRKLASSFVFLALGLAACSGGGSPSVSSLPVVPDPPAPPIPVPQAVPDQVLVMMQNPDDGNEVDELLNDFSGVSIERIGSTAFFLLTLPQGSDVNQVIQSLDEDLRVVLSEPNYEGQAPEGGPSDVPILGGDLIQSISTQAALAPLDLASAQAISTGAGVTVAVIDTGVIFGHPALAGHLLAGGFDFVGRDADPTDERTFFDEDGDGLVDEQFGHGTFVASLVLAVAPEAEILPVRVLNDEGFGTASTVAAGIVWAVDAGATVLNISVDLPVVPEVVKEALKYAQDNDVLIVAAAGNGGQPDLIFPARFSQVIGVAAVGAGNVATAFTNYGAQASLVAPGERLIGAFPQSLNPAGTARWSGTSFSSPLVAGAAALVRSHFPALASADVSRRLLDSALSVDAANPAKAGMLGQGLVQPAAALAP